MWLGFGVECGGHVKVTIFALDGCAWMLRTADFRVDTCMHV
jgi:hypothetical protein